MNPKKRWLKLCEKKECARKAENYLKYLQKTQKKSLKIQITAQKGRKLLKVKSKQKRQISAEFIFETFSFHI